MANYFCMPLHKVAEADVVKVKVPTGATLVAGNVILCETLDTTDSDNRDVYLGAQTSDVTAEYPCIVISQRFEQLSDGRRPAGQPDQTQISYAAGSILTAIRLRRDYQFSISYDSIETTTPLAVGGVVVAQNSSYQLDSLAAAVGTEKVVLGVEKLETVGDGGAFGAAFFSNAIVRVTEGR